MNSEKRTLIPYIYNFSIKDLLNFKFSEESYKFKFLLFMDTLNLINFDDVIWPTCELLYDCVHRELNGTFSLGSMKEI